MRRIVIWLGLFLVSQLAASCGVFSRGDASTTDINSPDSALVYGYVEADNDSINRVDIHTAI